MKVGLFTDTYYPEINGVANSVYALKSGLEEMGHTVYVFTVTNPNTVETEKNIFRIPSVPYVFIHDRRMGIALMSSWMKRIENLELDVIHTNTEFTLGYLGRKAAKKFHIPLLHTYHTIYEEYTHYLKIPENHNESVKSLIRGASRIYCDGADEVVVPTLKVKRLLEQYGVNKNISVCPTGIDLQKFSQPDEMAVTAIKKRYQIQKTDKILLYVGRLSKEKNMKEILSYFSVLHREDDNIKLMIVGDGPQRENLEKQIQEEEMTKAVILTGEVPWQEISDYYHVGDIFVCASKSETQGLTYLEAMAAGTALVVRKDDCLKDLLIENETGYSYETQQEFMQKIRLAFDQGRLEKIGMQARHHVLKYGISYFAKNIENRYRSVINGSNYGITENETEQPYVQDNRMAC